MLCDSVKDKSFIYSILRKYCPMNWTRVRAESHNLTWKHKHGQMAKGQDDIVQRLKRLRAEPQKRACALTHQSLVLSESLFSGASTEEKKELLEL